MTKRHVLIAPATIHRIPGRHLDLLREAGFDWEYPGHPHQLTEDELLRDLDRFDAVLAGSEPYTRRVFESAPRLRFLARVGVGYDAVDLAAATQHGVVVTTTPGANQDAVGEHVLGLILSLARGLTGQDREIKAGRWPRTARLPLRGRTLGIVGLGRTGKAVARRAATFAMKLLATEPVPDLEFIDQFAIQLVPLEQLLQSSDFVTLHVPLTEETRGLIRRETLAQMKCGAFLINASRGSVVYEADLVEALQRGALAGAGLDVFEDEPPPANHPLFGMEQVVLTAHVAGHDLQSRDDMAFHAAQCLAQLSRGEWPAESVVNGTVRQRFEARQAESVP